VDVTDHADALPQLADHVAIHDLHMVDVRHERLARPATIPRARVAGTERKEISAGALPIYFLQLAAIAGARLHNSSNIRSFFGYRAGCQLCPIGLFTLDDMGHFKGHESRNHGESRGQAITGRADSVCVQMRLRGIRRIRKEAF
jgi:hypothetical protein